MQPVSSVLARQNQSALRQAFYPGSRASLSPTLEDYEWLAGPDAEPWLAAVQAETGSAREPDVAFVRRFRKDLPRTRVHLLLEQHELRERARAKFSRAEQMLFTRKGLEQATDEQIARYKAARFGHVSLAYDLCCGIGGDLLALGQERSCVGVDADLICFQLAQHNARVYDATATVACSRVEGLDLPRDCGGWHIDPDRRPTATRTTHLSQFEPPVEAIDRLLAQCEHAAIKIAPASELDVERQARCEREWLGSRGECRQQVAWFGAPARHAGQAAATVVDAAGGPRTIVGQPGVALPVAGELGTYLFEPHAAVLAARLSTALATEHGLLATSSGPGYLTGDRLVHDGALATFQVLDVLPLDRKQLRAYCRERGIGRLEVKKRGVQIEPERLRKEIISRGEHDATLIVTIHAGKTRAIFVRRITP